MAEPTAPVLILVTLLHAVSGQPIVTFEFGSKGTGVTFATSEECEKARHSDTFFLALDDTRISFEQRLNSPLRVRTRCGDGLKDGPPPEVEKKT
jgi:hypothetical protein